MVVGIVSVPLSLTFANAFSPIRFNVDGKKVEVKIVSVNDVKESNAKGLISTIV